MKKNKILTILAILCLCFSLNVGRVFAWGSSGDSTSGTTSGEIEKTDTIKTDKYAEKYNTFTYDEIQVCKIKNVIDASKIVGKIIVILKILVPAILIIVSVKGLANALIDQNDKELNNFVRIFIQRLILAVFIFFIPTLIDFLLSYTAGNSYETVHNDYANCVSCVMNPEKCPKESQLYVLNPQSTGGDMGENEYIPYTQLSSQVKEADCTGMLGSTTNPADIAYYVQMAFSIMKYVGVVICIVFSALEILKAVMGNDKDMYKPVVTKTIKRMCYAAVLLFLPQIIDAIMTITGLYSSCGIK